MKMRLLAATAAAAMAFAATSANAVTVIATVEGDLTGTTLATYGQIMLDDFDAIDSAATTYAGNIIEYPDEFENPITTTAPPPGDLTNYASVQGGQTATYTIGGGGLRSFSFYLGSPDTYNKVRFNFAGGGFQELVGTAIWDGPNFNGDRTKGFRVYYDLGGQRVTSINFSSTQNAFEFDGLAGAIPEPGTWALMIMGFGGAGAMIRRRRAAVAA